MQFFAEKGDFQNKKRPKRDPQNGLGLLRDPGFPKRDPVGSSERPTPIVIGQSKWLGSLGVLNS